MEIEERQPIEGLSGWSPREGLLVVSGHKLRSEHPRPKGSTTTTQPYPMPKINARAKATKEICIRLAVEDVQRTTSLLSIRRADLKDEDMCAKKQKVGVQQNGGFYVWRVGAAVTSLSRCGYANDDVAAVLLPTATCRWHKPRNVHGGAFVHGAAFVHARDRRSNHPPTTATQQPSHLT
jgi:hypothetical protein